PGPGRYALPPTIGYINRDLTKPSSPAYTFHKCMSSNSTPGPQYHIDAKMTPFGRVGTPSYSIGHLLLDILYILSLSHPLSPSLSLLAELFQTPGPGAYSPEKAHLRPPSDPIGSRYTLRNLLGSQVPHKPSSASYSLAGRRQVGAPSEDRSMTPGPGRYNSTDPSVYLTRQPSFSMQSRTTRARDQCQKPGPGTHSPEKVLLHLPRPPAFSLGIRHLEFITPLVVVVSD
uniref:Outer dense fiber of sperm tails 3-like 2a n=1 Tax=Hucho hucho TaxID=62062 RepID=A0A4W5R8T1_9TELE